jgi:CRP/FNR family transcriptional regulator, cyclic AMP receptor protein
MTDRALEAVAKLAAEVEFVDGDTLISQGDPGESFYVVVQGTVRVSRDGSVVRDLGEGEFMGEIALVDGRPRTATAVAVGPVRTLEISRVAFQELMDRFSAVRLGVLMALTDRVRTDEESVTD